nr:MAG TPA: hypothetical protein [Caudoviricetes sp.]
MAQISTSLINRVINYLNNIYMPTITFTEALIFKITITKHPPPQTANAL